MPGPGSVAVVGKVRKAGKRRSLRLRPPRPPRQRRRGKEDHQEVDSLGVPLARRASCSLVIPPGDGQVRSRADFGPEGCPYPSFPMWLRSANQALNFDAVVSDQPHRQETTHRSRRWRTLVRCFGGLGWVATVDHDGRPDTAEDS